MKTHRESLLDIDSVQSSLDPIKIIDEWCKENVRGTYEIDPKTLDINSNSDIEIINKDITEIPGYIHFGTIRGNFNCSNCNLTSLEGAPKEVGGDFGCAYCNSLISLKGSPKEVGGGFGCSYCDNLTSLKGAPKEVGGPFYCSWCRNLTSLKGAPEKVGESFSCYNCGKKFTKDDVKKVCNAKDIRIA